MPSNDPDPYAVAAQLPVPAPVPPPQQQWPAQQPQQYAPVPAQPLAYATPMQYAPMHDLVWREAEKLIIRKDTALPDLCVKCNAPGGGYRWRKTLYWHHPALYLLIFMPGILIYAIVALIVRKKCKVEATLCPRHRSRRNMRLLIGWVTGLLGLASFIGGFVLLADRHTEDYAPFAILAGIVLGIGGLLFGTYGARVLYAKKMDDNFAWLAGAGSEFLANFPPVQR